MSQPSGHQDRTYAFCTRFFAELRGLGVTEAVVSPGSRSTPLALAAHACGLSITVQLDERVAGFHALGQARATGRPSVLICTSGTAGANYFPAVIEAHHSGIPMVVCTADRPPELRQWGAGQTIDQVHLYGARVRWFHELPVPSEVDAAHARSLALRAVTTAVDEAGPVHLNWPFREPLAPAGPIHVPNPSLSPVEFSRQRPPASELEALGHAHERGLIVVGPADLPARVTAEIGAFAARHAWPIIADPASGFRGGSVAQAPLVSTAELLLTSAAFVDELAPADAIVRVGPAPTSKAYRLWLEEDPPAGLVLVDPGVEWADPTDAVTSVVAGPLAGAFASDSAGEGRRDSRWLHTWLDADETAGRAIAQHLTTPDELRELDVVAALGTALADRGPSILMVSNSMPIRDLDVVLRPAEGSLRVIANRGANGIDGVIATAGGLAQASGLPTTVLVGDVATVHDLGGLAAAARLGLDDMTVVVIDNNAGGIFSFLPIASAIDADAFDELFGTPHDTDLAAVGDALGFTTTAVTSLEGFTAALHADETGPGLIVARTRAATTVDQLGGLRDAVDAALRR